MPSLSTDATDVPAPGESVLVLCPLFSGAQADACIDLLTPSDPADEAVLVVALTRSAAAILDRWETHADGTPATTTVLEYSDGDRAAADETALDADRPELDVEPAPAPDNLTELGVRVTAHANRLADEPAERTVACFQSVSALLQYVEPSTAAEFLDRLADTLGDAGVSAHFHMDPSAHDEETIEEVVIPFDTVLEYDRGQDRWSTRGA